MLHCGLASKRDTSSSSASDAKGRTKKNKSKSARRGGIRGGIRFLVVLCLGVYFGLHVVWAIVLVALKYVNPPTTGVQIQRRVESWFPQTRWRKMAYQKRMEFVPLDKIAIDLQHAVIASEDGNYYKHHGVDWTQVEKVAQESAEKGKLLRGASTLEQQLVKNLFFTTHRNPIRKGFEYTLAPMADTILGKRRALELYLNVVEWGPGVWGIEAASQYHYHTSAAKLNRDQAMRLASCLPSPRRYRPAMMNDFSASIDQRMRLLGW